MAAAIKTAKRSYPRNRFTNPQREDLEPVFTGVSGLF